MLKQDYEKKDQNTKYAIGISQSPGVAIGDHAHVEQHFHAASPLPPPVSRDDLLSAIRQASAELRAYPSDIAGVHIARAEVRQITDWLLRTDHKERVGMLLDQPGSGKTVVMRDILEYLEASGIPVLAIKADTLSSISNHHDAAERLGLPASVETCARELAAGGTFIVLLDQLDALSLTLSRDQATLDVMLDTVARLRNVDGVRMVASCRTFDLKRDPRLSAIKIDREFRLQPLDDSQVSQVLQTIGTDLTHLLPGHQTLLRVPLHLSIYARIASTDAAADQAESFRSLQELYGALWRKWIEIIPPDVPPPRERIDAIYMLVDAIQNRHQLTAPVAVLDECPEGAIYLERVRFIRQHKGNWSFSHETLFDYCYARRFVAAGKALCQEVVNGPQGLFERSQMVQVLAYLRGSDEAAYRRELVQLLRSQDLRVHLRLLLLGWFGSLPNPNSEEQGIARRLMSRADDQILFLQATAGNEAWFDLMSGDVWQLLDSNDERVRGTVINYLSTLIQQRTGAILRRLRPHLAESESWDAGIAFCLFRLEDWHNNDDAVALFCDLLSRGRTFGWEHRCFHHLVSSDPAAACQALRVYLDRRLEILLAWEEAERQKRGSDANSVYRVDSSRSFARSQELLNDYIIGQVVREAVRNCTADLVLRLLPWFARAATCLAVPHSSDEHYPPDTVFSLCWFGDHISQGPILAMQIAEALSDLARGKPADFRAIANELANMQSLSVQRVLAQAYLSDPIEYADDIFNYIVSDPWRLNIGEELENPHYDSYRLYSAAFQNVDAGRRAILEDLILGSQPAWERWSFRQRELSQLIFLASVPFDLLSMRARGRLQELQCKFPDFRPQEPIGIQTGVVGPPIDAASQQRMSDDNWLSAMRKYSDDGDRHSGFLKGGASELASSFAELVKTNPERFYNLARRFDAAISLHYITAAISGLAGSQAPAEWVFDLVRQFAPRIEGDSRRGVCWALSKRAEAGVPDDLLDLMADWALHDPDPDQELWRIRPGGSDAAYFNGDPHDHGINTNRGAALLATCRCAMHREPPQAERTFALLEQAANDPSTAVRTCVIECLESLLSTDEHRVLVVFEHTMDGQPRLVQTPVVHQFICHMYHTHFPRLRPFIEAMLTHADDVTRQAGARLACLAAFTYPEAEALAEQAVHGDPIMRRGAAQVYARKLERTDLEATCRDRLVLLMHDPDEQVRAHMGECFSYLHPEQLDHLRPFVEEFLSSPSLLASAEHLVKFLKPLAADEPDLALRATARILEATGNEIVDLRTSAARLEPDMVQLPLAVYTRTDDQSIKSRAMELFERLLLLGSRTAHQALADWDRR